MMLQESTEHETQLCFLASALAFLTANTASGHEKFLLPIINHDFQAVDVGLDAGDPLPFILDTPIGWEPFTEMAAGVAVPGLPADCYVGTIDPIFVALLRPKR